MAKKNISPDYIFETSWEVCNKVGGIYTVLSSRAKTMQEHYADRTIFIGPDVWGGKHNPDFKEQKPLLRKWRETAAARGLNVRIGRWQVPGEPIAVLVDFAPLFDEKNEIYARAYEKFGVESIKAYGDYDEASMFSVAAGRFVEAIAPLLGDSRIVYQAHEWMSGMGMMFLKDACPGIATIFTTHATSIGRSIAGNNKNLYQYFEHYDGDQMAGELSMEAKHSVEKQSAHHADCFTTVSAFTDRECAQLLEKKADVVLPNGFEKDFVPSGAAFARTRKAARKRIFEVASALTGQTFAEDTLIVSTSGRNDFRCKGFDVFLEALHELNERLRSRTAVDGESQYAQRTQVLALIEVPCWLLAPRTDLQECMAAPHPGNSLPWSQISHDLHNLNEDRILCLIRQLGLNNTEHDPVKVILVPCYLDGKDGIFDMPYYDLLTANDLAIYPSYYEPWGYTPLESIAFKTPCITTDLSGFGQWINATLGHEGQLEDGVKVIHRDDCNYFDVAGEIGEAIREMMRKPADERAAIAKKAEKLAGKALWKNFFKHYQTAYETALNKTNTSKI
ncbi:MAG: glycogen/starch synthase [Prevotellaceae bacterium]|nr:glycogen/starch synthase [Prevotellaceae bacterium]